MHTTADKAGEYVIDPQSQADSTVSLSFGAVTFALGAMWSMFVISYVIFDRLPWSKAADFALYLGCTVALPIVGYVALQFTKGFAIETRRMLWFEIFTLLMISASTFAASSSLRLSLVLIYLAVAALFVFSPVGKSAVQVAPAPIISVRFSSPIGNSAIQFPPTAAMLVWIRNIAATVLGISFFRLAFTNIKPYLYWPHQDTPLASWGLAITRYGPTTSRILAGAAVAFVVLLLVRLAAESSSRKNWRIGTEKPHYVVWILAGALIAYLLICPIPYFETYHYTPYLGAYHVFYHGGWPLVDAFSQYGLSFLAYFPLGFLLPFNFASAAFVTNAFHIAMLLVMLAMIYKFAGDCKFALPIAAIFVIVIWLSLPYNLVYTPSGLGVRWLPIWVLALILVPGRNYRPQFWSRGAAVVALNVCALWSLETHLVAVAIFGLHSALVTRLSGSSLWRAIAEALKAIPLSLIGHAIFIMATLVARGEMPSYGIYLEFFQTYRSGHYLVWLLYLKGMIVTNIWLLFVAVYAAIMFLAFTSFMLGRSVFSRPRVLIGLSVMAAVGIGEGGYFVGHPATPLIACVALPLYTIVIWFLIFFVDRAWRLATGIKRELALAGAAVLIAVPVGYAWDRAAMEYNGGPMGSSNASLLVRCIRYGDCNPMRQFASIAASIRENPHSLLDAPQAKDMVDDAVKLYSKWRGSAPAIAMVAPQRAAALVRLGAQDALRANSLQFDNLSPTLMARLASRLDTMPAGSLIMTVNITSPYEIRLLCGLLKRYRLERVDFARDTFVDRLVPRDDEFEIGSPMIEIDGKPFFRMKNGSTVAVKRAPTGVNAGFVEQFRIQEDAATIDGWVIDQSTYTVPKTVVMTLHDRIWALARPSVERVDIGATHRSLLKSGFRLYVCGVDPSDVSDFRAYAVMEGGPAVELQYPSGAPLGQTRQ